MRTEIKLLVDAAGAGKIKKLPALNTSAVSQPQSQEYTDRYFDTGKFELWKHGLSLRVRSTGTQHLQTLTGNGSVATGPHRHAGLEGEVPSETPDPQLFMKQLRKVLPNLVHHLDGEKLAPEPVFVNHAKRTVWTIALPDGTQVDCALDLDELQREEHITQVHELELGLKDGEPARLYELAQQVHRTIPVRIENTSMAERGYALATGDKVLAVKAMPVRLKPKDSLGEALSKIIWNCLHQIHANERGVLAGDVESLHQMRVGLRRLRAALAMVGSMVQLPAPIHDDIEWLAGELGDARNWDVFLDTVLPGMPFTDEQRPALERVEAAARGEAERHRSRVRAAVSDPRYTTLVLAMDGWIAHKGWRDAAPPADPLEQRTSKAAPQLVQHAAARVRKRVRNGDLKRPECLHKVRIAAKKERYAREFFATLSHAGNARRRHDMLAKMQDELGEINDTFVARKLVAELRERLPEETRFLGFIEGVLAERALDAMPRARKHVRRRMRYRAAFKGAKGRRLEGELSHFSAWRGPLLL